VFGCPKLIKKGVGSWWSKWLVVGGRKVGGKKNGNQKDRRKKDLQNSSYPFDHQPPTFPTTN